MGVVIPLYALDPAQAALAAQSLPTVHRLRIERTDTDLFPDPLLQRPLRPQDPALPSIGDTFDPYSWDLQEALAGRNAVYMVDDVATIATVVSGELVIEHAIGVRCCTWLDEPA